MAIRGTNKKRQDAINQEAGRDRRVIGQGHAQPPAFRATGRGLGNKMGNLSATAHNANATIRNLASAAKDPDLRKLYLFVNAIQTGWALAGEHGQGQLGRVFYPRNLTQDEFVVEGIVANNYEYDKVVRFVEHHHHTQFASAVSIAQSLDGNDQYLGVDFKLFRPVNSSLATFTPFKYGVLITDMTAGAERFKYAREYQLQCKVTYDYLQSPWHLEQGIKKLITRQTIFGSAANPAPRTGNESQSNITTATDLSTSILNPKTSFNQR